MKNIFIYFLISTSFVYGVSETIKQIKIKIGRLGDLDALIPKITGNTKYFVSEINSYHRTLCDIRSVPYYEKAWYGMPNRTDHTTSALSLDGIKIIIDWY
jgi:hypothetical protein